MAVYSREAIEELVVNSRRSSDSGARAPPADLRTVLTSLTPLKHCRSSGELLVELEELLQLDGVHRYRVNLRVHHCFDSSAVGETGIEALVFPL